MIVAVGEGWHAGVIGIIASRLKDKYRRPAVVIAFENGIGRGSGRSVPGVDLGAMIQRALKAGLLIAGGGHKMAAGLTLDRGRLADFQAFLAAEMAADENGGRGAGTLELDGMVAVSGATLGLCDALEQAGPYGAGHPEPCLAIAAARLLRADIVGQRHVRCILTGADGSRLEAIAFRAMDGRLGPFLLGNVGGQIHLAGALRGEIWQQRRKAQLFIEDAAAV